SVILLRGLRQPRDGGFQHLGGLLVEPGGAGGVALPECAQRLQAYFRDLSLWIDRLEDVHEHLSAPWPPGGIYEGIAPLRNEPAGPRPIPLESRLQAESS